MPTWDDEEAVSVHRTQLIQLIKITKKQKNRKIPFKAFFKGKFENGRIHASFSSHFFILYYFKLPTQLQR